MCQFTERHGTSRVRNQLATPLIKITGRRKIYTLSIKLSKNQGIIIIVAKSNVSLILLHFRTSQYLVEATHLILTFLKHR